MRIAMLLLVLPLVVACSAVDKAEPKAPDVTADKASVTKISPAGIELLVELGVYNPNSIALQAEALTAKVVLDGNYDMGTVDIPQEVDLPSKQQIHVAVPVDVDWKDATVVAALIALKRDVPYDINGSVKIGVDLFKVSVDFHVKDVITEDQMRQAAGNPPPGEPPPLGATR
jgi:LEA14-like dessication related protein